MADNQVGAVRFGGPLMTISAALGAAVSVYNYLSPDSGIAGTPGAVLVIVSTAILFLFGLTMMVDAVRGAALRILLAVFSLLDIVGTALAAYLLDSQALLILMLIGLLGWLLHLFRPRPAPA
jgi:hypothetical protein